MSSGSIRGLLDWTSKLGRRMEVVSTSDGHGWFWYMFVLSIDSWSPPLQHLSYRSVPIVARGSLADLPELSTERMRVRWGVNDMHGFSGNLANLYANHWCVGDLGNHCKSPEKRNLWFDEWPIVQMPAVLHYRVALSPLWPTSAKGTQPHSSRGTPGRKADVKDDGWCCCYLKGWFSESN